MGRSFPPADESGAADPFIIFRCAGEKTKSKIKYITLNPGWFETLDMKVRLPPLDDNKNFPQPGFSMLVYDADSWGKKDLIGRRWVDIFPTRSTIPDKNNVQRQISSHKPPEWHSLYFDATDSEDGFVLLSYELIKEDIY